MQKTNLDKIKDAVEQAYKFPSATIEYNLELPESKHITPDSFFGIKAVYNKMVDPVKGVNVIFRY